MARISFRQGIVDHQTDTFNTPTFLDVTAGYVSLMTTNDVTTVTFAHGQKDYLYTEFQSQISVWGPFAPGDDHWLYMELNAVTGAREFGSTNLEPVVAANQPSSPSVGQMFFDTTFNMWYYYNGSTWVETIRCFICKMQGGVTPVSVSINAPDFRGTQVGLNVPASSGALMFDQAGKPVRDSSRKFFTTEDQFFTNVATGTRIKVENTLISGIAQEPLHAYQVVQYIDYNELMPAVPFARITKLYGIIEQDSPFGAVVDFVTEGMISNQNWAWIDAGAEVNDPVYIDNSGALSLTQHIGAQLPVGVIMGQREVYFAPSLFGKFGDKPPTPLWGDIFGNITDQVDLQGELDGKSDLGHLHTLGNIVDSGELAAVDDAPNDGNEYARQNGGWAVVTTGGSGATAYIGLTDTPGNYIGHGGKLASVKTSEDMMEFIDAPNLSWGNIGGTLSNQTDLQLELNGKSDVGHSHVKADITDFTHNHVKADITDFAHSHVKADITDFAHNHTVSDIDAEASTDGYVITSDGAGNAAWEVLPASGGLPTSNDECNVLVSNAVGGWYETSPLELPRPYDLAPVFLVVDDNVNAIKVVSTQKMTLVDYGHQGHSVNTGTLYTTNPWSTSATEFDISVNGLKIGELGFHSATAADSSYFTCNVGSGWPNGNGFYMGGFISIDVGDVIVITTPNSPPSSMTEVGLTLRGFVEPAVPCGTIGVAFSDGKNIASNDFYLSSESMSMAYTGSITYAEWAVVGYVADSKWPPTGLDGNNIIPLGSNFFGYGGAQYFTGPACYFDVPGVGATDFTNTSQYVKTGTFIPLTLSSFSDDTAGAAYYLIRCTVFGPGGIATDLAWVKQDAPPAP